MKSRRLSILLPIVVLTSCASGGNKNVSYITSSDEGTTTVYIHKNNNSTSTERYIAPRNVEVKYTQESLNGIMSGRGTVLPSIGNSKLLVIPVHLPGSTYNTEAVRKDIEKAFFGDDNRYPSVADYFATSSYGKLRLSGEVTDWFDVTKTSVGNDLANVDEDHIRNVIIEEAVSWAVKEQGISRSDYDGNGDGFIDAVYLVYDHYDYETVYDQYYKGYTNITGNDISGIFVNHTLWTENTPFKNAPEVSGYAWCSFASLYKGYCAKDANGYMELDDLKSIDVDSHPFIHETGHLLGLKDYSNGGDYNPLGKFSMMDNMTGDLDSYSKITLGWITPYIVYGTSNILLEKANKNDHSVIIIPSNFEDISDEIEGVVKTKNQDKYKYSFNPFSEYIMVDMFTSDLLNEKDIGEGRVNYSNITNTKGGVRIYHVDSRLFTLKTTQFAGGTKVSVANSQWDGEEISEKETLVSAITNGNVESSTYGLYTDYDYLDQIRLVESGKLDTFSYGGNFERDTLFEKGGNEFSIIDYGYQFFNSSYTYNDGNEMPFYLKVRTLEDVTHE